MKCIENDLTTALTVLQPCPLQAGFEGLDVKRHRSMAHLPNASPRALVRRRNRPLSPPGYTGIL